LFLKKLHIIYTALLLSAVFIFSNPVQSQDLMELKPGADKLSFNRTTGEHKLVGNIHILYQRNEIYCDSASYFKENDLLKLYGNVHISKSDTLNLYCDSMHYNGSTQIGKLWGHVRVRDREFKISTDTLTFDSKKDVATYLNGGRIENIKRKEEITSLRGYFYPKSKNISLSKIVDYSSPTTKMQTDTIRFQYGTKRIYFYSPTNIQQTNKTTIYCERGWMNTETEECFIHKNAVITKPKKTLAADTLYAYEQKGLSSAYGHIRYEDSDKGVSFEGNKLYYSKKEKRSYLTKNPYISYKLKKDTLYVKADTLFLFHDTLDEIDHVRGYHSGKIFSANLQGVSDSLYYSKKQNLLTLYKSPYLWNKNAQINGEVIHLFIKDSLLDHAEIMNKAVTVTEVDSGKYYNQIGGKNMYAYFDINNDLKKIDVQGNAQTIYYPEETANKDTLVEITRKGMVRLYASSIKVYLDSGEFKKVTYADQADGMMYPMEKINTEEQFVANYTWKPLLRPKNKIHFFTNEKNIKEKKEVKKLPVTAKKKKR
jgi:lipopolysaccharide export system protein LptA